MVDYYLLSVLDSRNEARERAYRCPVIEGLKERFVIWRNSDWWTSTEGLVDEPIRGEALTSLGWCEGNELTGECRWR